MIFPKNFNGEFPFYRTVKISPGSTETKVIGEMDDGTLKISISAAPEKGKANELLKKFFKKTFGVKVSIISGETERKKLLKIEQL
jgi:uncharacterized protein